MRFSSIISIALAAGSAVSAPVAVFKGHLHKRDHHAALLRRSQEASASASSASSIHKHLLAREANPDGPATVYETVYVTPSSPATTEDAQVVYVTEVAMVTVVVDQNGRPRSTNNGGVDTGAADPSTSNPSPSTTQNAETSAQTLLQSAAIATTSTAQQQTSSDAAVSISSSVTQSSVLASSSSTLATSSTQVSLAEDKAADFSAPTSSSVQTSSESPSSTEQVETSSATSVVESTTSSSFSSSASSSSVSSSSAAASATSTASVSGVPQTITYSPYNDDKSCKDSDAVYSDLSKIAALGIKAVRIYGTDCNSISTVEPACVKLNLKIDQGFWIGPQGADSIDDGVQELISWVQQSNNNDWSLFTTFTIGNEAVYAGYVDGSTLLSKIKSVKSTLQSAGWSGTVTTAEPPGSYYSYPELCTDTDGIDYVGLNAHPYFDATSSADSAGSFVLSQIEAVKGVCNNRDVSITETGYPSAGNTNGNQVPSEANQATAIGLIMEAVPDAVMFTVYDDKWKDAGSYNVEQHFGILHLFE